MKFTDKINIGNFSNFAEQERELVKNKKALHYCTANQNIVNTQTGRQNCFFIVPLGLLDYYKVVSGPNNLHH